MIRRTMTAALVGGALLLFGAPAAQAAAPLPTAVSLKATELTGHTPGKVLFAGKVSCTTSTRIVTAGIVDLSIDGGTPVALTVKAATGRYSYTHHYKVGTHTATAHYLGGTTFGPSTVTITFTVT